MAVELENLELEHVASILTAAAGLITAVALLLRELRSRSKTSMEQSASSEPAGGRDS
jgi:hypothetical protein